MFVLGAVDQIHLLKNCARYAQRAVAAQFQLKHLSHIQVFVTDRLDLPYTNVVSSVYIQASEKYRVLVYLTISHVIASFHFQLEVRRGSFVGSTV